MLKAVLSGSFRRDPEGLRSAFEALKAAGCEVLSPRHLNRGEEKAGFVFLEGQIGEPRQIEDEHLRAISQADFVWLHCPAGYVGLSGALEIGYAISKEIPVFASIQPTDTTMAAYVRVVDSPAEAVRSI